VGLTLLPRIPLLFVATAREVAEPRSYLTALVARPPPVVQPVLFLIKRRATPTSTSPSTWRRSAP
jgi:hypothetical protein